MELDLSYAHRRFLGLTGSWPNEEPVALPANIHMSSEAANFLRGQLEAPGVFRAGPLFGRIHDDCLSIEFAAPRGYDPANEEDPLKFNPGYVLGWVDALRAAQPQHPLIDWVGCWISFPDAEIRQTETEAHWVNQARQTRLVDDFRYLTFIGWRENRFCARIYGYDVHVGPFLLTQGSATDAALRTGGPYPELQTVQP